jgi:hypothetical protein
LSGEAGRQFVSSVWFGDSLEVDGAMSLMPISPGALMPRTAMNNSDIDTRPCNKASE